jgi:hypothetical protein
MRTPSRLRTSEYLQRCLDRPTSDKVPLAVASRLNDPQLAWFHDYVGGVLLYQYEGLHDVLRQGSVSSPDTEALPEILDDALSRLFVKAVPLMVRRLMQFERILTEEQPNESVRAYFEEAMRCYALGLASSSVALARACMEQAFRDTVQLPYLTDFTLDTLIKAADRTKLLGAAHQQMARDVQQTGNQVMHRQPCTDEQAVNTIVKVRAVVEQLYRPGQTDEHS